MTDVPKEGLFAELTIREYVNYQWWQREPMRGKAEFLSCGYSSLRLGLVNSVEDSSKIPRVWGGWFEMVTASIFGIF